MSSTIRFLVLGCCAAAGVGAAIAVATQAELPAPSEVSAAANSTSHPLRPGRQRPLATAHAEDHGPTLLTPQAAVTQQVAAPKSSNDAAVAQAMGQMADMMRDFTELVAADRKAQAERAIAPRETLPPPTPVAPTPATPTQTLPPVAPKPADPVAAAKRPSVTRDPAGDHSLVINAQGADIHEVLDLLGEQGGLNILASKNVQGKVNASLKNVSIDTALNAILRSTGYAWRRETNFVYVGTPEDFKAQDRASDRIGTRLYRPNYVPAKELEQLITPLLTETVGKVKATAAPQKGIAPDPTNAGGDEYAGADAVIVRDYEAVLNVIDELVADVDKRPTQVAIEAMILSVRLNDRNKFGVDFALLRDKAHVKLATGTPLATLGELNFRDGGLKFGYLDGSLGVFVEALETIGETDIVATPRLMCLNRQKAEILIGAELGYVSTTQTETSSTQSVEFLEVGTQLRLRPYIANDGFVRMEVHPELSTGEVRVEQNFTLPNKETTQVTTNIMVRDGSTVIIGGLIRDELTNNVTQIPFLGSLPLVGPIFRRSDERNERRELLVLITPHIVYEPEMGYRGDKAAREFHHRHMQYADKLSPLGKRYLGRKYFHGAQQAWHAGDQKRALKLIELSLHFDPQRRAALDLRADIAAGAAQGDHTDVHPRRIGPGLNPLDSDILAPWLLNDLQSLPAGPPRHALDPGVPQGGRPLNRPDAGAMETRLP